jgi:hypothetical protein
MGSEEVPLFVDNIDSGNENEDSSEENKQKLGSKCEKENLVFPNNMQCHAPNQNPTTKSKIEITKKNIIESNPTKTATTATNNSTADELGKSSDNVAPDDHTGDSGNENEDSSDESNPTKTATTATNNSTADELGKSSENVAPDDHTGDSGNENEDSSDAIQKDSEISEKSSVAPVDGSQGSAASQSSEGKLVIDEEPNEKVIFNEIANATIPIQPLTTQPLSIQPDPTRPLTIQPQCPDCKKFLQKKKGLFCENKCKFVLSAEIKKKYLNFFKDNKNNT